MLILEWLPTLPLPVYFIILLAIFLLNIFEYNSNTTTMNDKMKASVYIALTLDGYIAKTDGSVTFLEMNIKH